MPALLIIYLGRQSLAASIDLPILPFKCAKRRRATYDLKQEEQYLFGLSTPKVNPAFAVASKAVGSYPTFSPLLCLEGQSGLFSVALAVTWL